MDHSVMLSIAIGLLGLALSIVGMLAGLLWWTHQRGVGNGKLVTEVESVKKEVSAVGAQHKEGLTEIKGTLVDISRKIDAHGVTVVTLQTDVAYLKGRHEATSQAGLQ